MSLCWKCRRPFQSDDVRQHYCESCRCQRKLFMYLEDEEEKSPTGAEANK